MIVIETGSVIIDHLREGNCLGPHW